jgi:hypothetical protein
MCLVKGASRLGYEHTTLAVLQTPFRQIRVNPSYQQLADLYSKETMGEAILQYFGVCVTRFTPGSV